jgi:hypothetical protein
MKMKKVVSTSAVITIVKPLYKTVNFKQCCGSGSRIRCLFDPWIRDGYKIKTGMNIPDHRIIFPKA